MAKTTHTLPPPRFPNPPVKYDRENEAQFRREVERLVQSTILFTSEVTRDATALAAHTHTRSDISNLPWPWGDVSKVGSSRADLATRSAGALNSGLLLGSRA